MIILYTKNNCVYCDKVKKVFSERRVAYEERNVENVSFLKEAQVLGAKMMPCMYDTVSKEIIQESDSIIDYASEYAF